MKMKPEIGAHFFSKTAASTPIFLCTIGIFGLFRMILLIAEFGKVSQSREKEGSLLKQPYIFI